MGRHRPRARRFKYGRIFLDHLESRRGTRSRRAAMPVHSNARICDSAGALLDMSNTRTGHDRQADKGQQQACRVTPVLARHAAHGRTPDQSATEEKISASASKVNFICPLHFRHLAQPQRAGAVSLRTFFSGSVPPRAQGDRLSRLPPEKCVFCARISNGIRTTATFAGPCMETFSTWVSATKLTSIRRPGACPFNQPSANPLR